MKNLVSSILLFLLATTANAATRYADPAGSGSACTVIGTPCTLATAVSQLVVGDTLYLRSGTYTNASGSLTLPAGTSWNAGGFTTVASYSTEVATFTNGFPFKIFNPGGLSTYVVFDGRGAGICPGAHACGLVLDANAGGWNDGISTGQGGGPYKWYGLEIKNAGSAGISMGFDAAGGNTFSYNYIHNGGCTDFDNAMYISSGNNEISYNEITGWAGTTIQIYGGSSNTNNLIHHNWLHETSGGVNAGIPGVGTCGGYTNGFRTQGIAIFTGSGHRVYNNLITNMIIGSGGALGAVQLAGISGVKIYNNTVYNSGVGVNHDYSGTIDEILKNNLLIDNSTCNICGSWATDSNNITTGSAASHFVATGSNNYALLSGSSAVDAGTSSIATGITQQYNGTAPDVGAFERFGSLNCEVGAVATNKLVCNFSMNLNQPIQITNTTGWSWTGGTLSSVAVTGSAQLTFTLSGAYGGGASTISYTEATGNATDSTLIGGNKNQRLSVMSAVTVTDNTGGPPAGSVGLSHWRIYLLQGATDTAWLAKCGEDSTNCTIPPGSKLWVRYKLRNNSGSNFAAFNATGKWRENGGTYYFPSDSYFYGYSCTSSIPPSCVAELSYVRVLGTKGTQLGTVLSSGSVLTADQLTSNEVTNVSCLANYAPTSIPSLTLNNSTEAECAMGIEVSSSAPAGTTLEMCPYKDDGTALTCSTPIKLTVGSYASVR